jgi:hypothetical protein
MRPLGFLSLLALPAAAAWWGCSTVVIATSSHGAGGGRTSSSTGFGAGGGGGSAESSSTGYVDPGCPDAGPPLMMFTCDPYAQNCPPNQGCYIFTQNPADPCGQEIYGSDCEPAGQGKQGAPCDGAGCAAGFTCTVTGSGNQCIELCQLEGNMSCPDGLVCQPIDVLGFGGCL